MQARLRDARKLVDDGRYEYACDVLFECQRGFNFLGKANFSTKLLHPMDPPPWCDPSMKLTLPNVHSFQLPDPSWEWVSPRWLIDMTLDVDEDGWQYATRFSNATWHGRHSAAKSFVRRRRWLRLRRRLQINPPSPTGVDDANLYSSMTDDGRPVAAEESYDTGFDASQQNRQRRRRMSKPVAVASKIKNTVQGNYVGATPKSPTKPVTKNLAYTLKDGKYKSHNLKDAAVGKDTNQGLASVLSSPMPVRRLSQPMPSKLGDTDCLLEGSAELAAGMSSDSSRSIGNGNDDGSHAGAKRRETEEGHGVKLLLQHQQVHSAIQLLQRKLSANWQGKDFDGRSSSVQHQQMQQNRDQQYVSRSSSSSSSLRSPIVQHSHHFHHHDRESEALPLPTG
ncbi:hypothetical protein GGF37_001995, partial [Kickxella alabastrina]